MNIVNWANEISKCKTDDTVGIRIAKLAGEKDFCTFITEINPSKSVNAHYHKNGDEHYHVINGSGEMYLKNVINGEEHSYKVLANESFVVPENTLHQLTNTGSIPLLLMFSCPASHLESDRYFL